MDKLGRWIAGNRSLLNLRPVPVYSIVTAGEILSFAARKSWETEKLNRLKFLLNHFERRYIDDSIADAYGVLDSETQSRGSKMGKNDLWIAALAYTENLTLMTTDRDFDPLATVFIQRDWIDPKV